MFNFKPLQILSTLNINIQCKAAVNINNCPVKVSTSMKALPRIPALRKPLTIFLIVALLWTAAWISRPTVREFMADVFVSTKQEGAGNGHRQHYTNHEAGKKRSRTKKIVSCVFIWRSIDQGYRKFAGAGCNCEAWRS